MADHGYDPIKALRQTQWFQDLTFMHISKIAEKLEYKEWNDGDILAEEGSPRTMAFFILAGKVKRSKTVEGEVCVIDTATPGQVLGLMHLLNEDPSYATATAIGQVKCWVLPSKAFGAILSTDTALSKAFTYTLAKRVRQFTKMVVPKQNEEANRVVLFDSKSYWVQQFDRVNQEDNLGLEIKYIPERLSPATAVLAEGAVAAICFVNDDCGPASLRALSDVGCQMISMRCAGYDRVDLETARGLDMLVTRVPAYSPYAVAEHAITLCMSLNRRICRASNRTKEHDFKLEGLLGFDMHQKTVGVLGTGRIGQIFINICLGFGCNVVCYDKYPAKNLLEEGRVKYVSQEEVLATSDVISLHCPLLPETTHLINNETIATMKKGALIINCGRGALIDTKALIQGLTSGHLGGAGLDVYENESSFFFSDHSDEPIQDEDLALLVQFPNVILTAHQAFFTQEGVGQIAKVSLDNIKQYIEGKTYDTHPNVVKK